MMNDLIKLYNKTNQFGELMDMKLTVLSPGRIFYTMLITEKHLAIPNVSHGGVVAALIDGTLGVAGLSAVENEGKVVSTIEFKVNYLKPALLGDNLKSSAQVISKGKRILYIEARVENQNQELIATGSGTFNSYPAERVFGKKE